MTKNLLPIICTSLLWLTSPVTAMEGRPFLSNPFPSQSASPAQSSQIPIAALTDFELIRLSQTIPSHVTQWELKNKHFIELVKFSASTAYRFSDADSLTTPLTLFTFSMDPDQKTYDFMPNLLEHKLLSDLLKFFYENLSSHINPITSPTSSSTPETKRRRGKGSVCDEEREDTLKEYIFSQEEEEHIQYASALKEMFSIHASPTFLDTERVKKSISLTTKQKLNCILRARIEKKKREKRSRSQLLSLSKSENMNFTMQFRNPRNKGTTTISMKILKNEPKDDGCYFPIYKSSLETFINTTFFNLVMSKLHESMQDIGRGIQSAKTTPKSLDYFS